MPLMAVPTMPVQTPYLTRPTAVWQDFQCHVRLLQKQRQITTVNRYGDYYA